MSLARGAFSGFITIYLQICRTVLFQLGVIHRAESCKILGAAKIHASLLWVLRKQSGKRERAGVSCISFVIQMQVPKTMKVELWVKMCL